MKIYLSILLISLHASAAETNVTVEIARLNARLDQLSAEVAALKSDLSNRAPANLIEGASPKPFALDISMIKVEGAATKVIEANDYSWRYAYNLRLKNSSPAPLKIHLEVQFYDAQSFTVEEKTEYGLVFAPNETRIISGLATIVTPAASTVKGVRGRIEYVR